MAPQDNRSLADLVAELSRENEPARTKEVELATTEMTIKARRRASTSRRPRRAGRSSHAGLLVLLAAIVIGLAQSA